MDVVGAGLVGREGHLRARCAPGGLLAAPERVAAAVFQGSRQRRTLACGQRACAADVDRGGLGLHGDDQLCRREGAVDLNASSDNIGSSGVGRKSKTAVSFLDFHIIFVLP